jgi:hypothetical protein
VFARPAGHCGRSIGAGRDRSKKEANSD